MANRFPLIVNPSTQKIEELSSGDNIDLSSSGIYAGGSIGTNGQFLKSNGTYAEWGDPGDVYLSGVQLISDKIFSNCTISGNTNSLSNIPNQSLDNSYITINGTNIPLGGSISVADNNTTYSISAVDGSDGTRKLIRLTSASPLGTDDITLKAGLNVSISRTGDEITFNSSYTDTITRLKSGSSSFIYGDITFTSSGSTSLSQIGNNIDISSTYINTITRLKGGSNGTLVSGDINLLQSGATTISQTSNDITISSQDTITRIKGGGTGSLVSGDVTIIGANATSVTQTSNVVTIDSTNTVTRLKGGSSGSLTSGDITILAAGASVASQNGSNITITSTDTITRLKGGASGSLVTGDVTIHGSGATTVSQNGNEITVSSTDNNTITTVQSFVSGTPVTGAVSINATGASIVSQSGNVITIDTLDTNTLYTNGVGLTLTPAAVPVFSLKNNTALLNNKIVKWDTSNGQLLNTTISDDGSTVTITGNLNVTGTTTTISTTNLAVADALVELRTGNNLVGADSGIQINRTTDSSGNVTAYQQLQWYESGAYWRSYNGSVSNRFVTENESQTLTNKTLTSPTLTNPSLGSATATTINKVTITQPNSGSTLTINEGKSLTINNSVSLSGTDNSTISFGGGGTVAYISNKLSVFSATTSDEIRGVISDEVGTGKLVFATNPEFTTSVTTLSTSFAVFNTTATTINAFGAATTITIGAATGTTTVRNGLTVNGNVILGDNVADTITINGATSYANEDILIRNIRVGRGASGIDTNLSVGKDSLRLVVGTLPGIENTAIGTETLYSNTQGSANTAVGYQALKTNSSGNTNIAIGKQALTSNTIGSENIAIGFNALNNNLLGSNNVCIGKSAGHNLTGTGNVIIGPAPDSNSSNATFQPPQVSGNYQLVIGSSSIAWIRGDSTGDIVIPNNLGTVGSLTIDGPTTTLNSRSLISKALQPVITGKVLQIGSVSTTTFTAQVIQGNTTIQITSWGTGIIPGMIITSQTDGVTVPSNTSIVSIDVSNSTAVISAAVNLGTGNVTFEAVGPSNTSADGGGLLLKGTTDKTLQFANASTSWSSNINFNVSSGRTYKINGTDVLSSNTLGSAVVNSSLTSVGTLSSLSISSIGTAVALTITNTGTGNCLVVNDESSDTTPFAIDNSGNISSGGTGTFASDVTITNGNLVIGTSGKGIDFSANANAAGMTSELLNDYEEGTWTPTLTFGGGSTGITYTTSPVGYYTRVGRMVQVQYGFQLSNKGSSTGNFQIGGLPFTVGGTGSFRHPTASVNAHFLASDSIIVGCLGNGSSIDFRKLNLSASDTNLTADDFTNITGFYQSMVYFV